MASVRLGWNLPVVGSQQRPLAETVVERRFEGGAWEALATVAADVQSEVVTADLPPGTHEFRATVRDIDGKEGPPTMTSVLVPFDPPGAVTNFTAELA